MRSGFFACAVPGLLASPMGEHNDLLSQSAHRPTVPAPQSQLKPAGSRTLQLCPGLAPDSLVQPAHGWALFASPMCHIRRVFAVCSVFSFDYSKKAMAALLDHGSSRDGTAAQDKKKKDRAQLSPFSGKLRSVLVRSIKDMVSGISASVSLLTRATADLSAPCVPVFSGCYAQ